MNIEFESGMGFTLTLPEGSSRVEESSAGPDTEQFSLPVGTLLSVVRDDEQVNDYAQTIEWTQKMALYYQNVFDGVVVTEGSLTSGTKKVYAVVVQFNDRDGVPRLASEIGIHFPGLAFFGLTLLSIVIDPEAKVNLQLVQELVDSFTLTTNA